MTNAERIEAARVRRAEIVVVLERKELMGATDIARQLGYEPLAVKADLAKLREQGVVAMEGAPRSRSTKWRLSSKTRKAATNGTGPTREAPTTSAPVDLRALIADKKAELVILESALAIAERAS